MPNTFKIIVPIYNSINWIEKCVMSIINQTYTDYQVILIDDASSDGTTKKLLDILRHSPIDKTKFKLFNRTLNVGAMENIVFGINTICKSDFDKIVLIDGDDWLSSNDVLKYLNEVYNDPNILLTYGSYENSTGGQGLNSCLNMSAKDYRKSNIWCTSHLRTFHYGLWKRIKDEDLKDSRGKYYSMSWDQALMFPMIEMADNDRIKYIDRTLYIYNTENPINDHKKNVSLQLALSQEIRMKSVYNKI